MKSFTKKITVLFALLAATLGMAIFAACGDNDKPDPDAFTVTVVDENGAPFTGVRVQLCEFDEETGELGICYPGVTVDANGKVTAVKKGTVTITAKAPSGKKATVKVKVG